MNALDCKRSEKGSAHKPIPGQVVDVRLDPVQTVGGGKGVEQPAAEQGRIRVVNEGRDHIDGHAEQFAGARHHGRSR